jgi:uncharacterized protein YdhG (YjbR/CyaY superfamily)
MPRPTDDFLANVEASKRTELERIRALARAIVPDAEETIAYGMPTLTYAGKPFLGFAPRAHHIGIYPYSGSVLPALADQLDGYGFSRSALRVPYDRPITKALLRKLIASRLKAIRAETTKRG